MNYLFHHVLNNIVQFNCTTILNQNDYSYMPPQTDNMNANFFQDKNSASHHQNNFRKRTQFDHKNDKTYLFICKPVHNLPKYIVSIQETTDKEFEKI